jgi:ferric-dicitrate binding protein FerR (iron transport regulator)
MRAAAVIVLLIAAIGVWRMYRQPNADRTEFASNTDKREITLPDGTHVWLRQEGRIEFPAQFAPGERRVRLTGEAYFEVFHNAAQPFRVELPGGGVVEVLGTQFDIRALAGDPETSVLVKTGKVRFSPDGKQTGTILVTGQKAVFARQQSRVTVTEVTSFNELAWQTGGLEFVKTPLATVITDLERYYKVHIELRNTALRTAVYTAPLTNQPIEKVLQSIALTYHMQVQKTNADHFVLNGGSDN